MVTTCISPSRKGVAMMMVLTTIIVAVAAIGLSAVPSDAAETGSCGDDITYTWADDGTVTLSGSGPMYDYGLSSDMSPFNASSITELIIGDGITSVGRCAFYGCASLESMTIPDSMTTIGRYAFFKCSSLTSIDLGGTKTVEMKAFSYCTSLKTAEVGESLKTLNSCVFYRCSKLQSIDLESSAETLKTIGTSCFYKCSSLEGITIPSNVTTIGSNAFTQSFVDEDGNALEATAESLKGYVYENVSGVMVRQAGIDVGDEYTSGNITYTVISTIPAKLEVSDCASSATSAVIPETITFDGTEFAITAIGDSAFLGCRSLTSVEADYVTTVGVKAFFACTGLQTVSLDSATKIDVRAFAYCSSLTDPGFGDSLKTISSYSFWKCTALESIILPESVTLVGSYSFYGCESLENIDMSSCKLALYAKSFGECPSVEMILMPTIKSMKTTSFDGIVFYDTDDNELSQTAANLSGNEYMGQSSVLYDVSSCTVTIDSASLSLEIDETATLTATVKPSYYASTLAWSSSDTSVATVSSSGVVTAVAAGTATVTASAGGISAACTVTVADSSTITGIDGLTVTYVSGTDGIVTYAYDESTGEYTVTFGTITEDSEYSMAGTLNGNVVIDVDETETYDFDLNLAGVTITSSVNSPIVILSADNASISATKKTTNVITDSREAVDSDEDGVYSGAIHSKVDLKLKGKGSLTVTSENNNGIHSKNDLEIKNLTLEVSCIDNALKGNDSVSITSGTITLYARQGDGIKTSDSDTKTDDDGTTTQRGNVTIISDDGDISLTIYAACDGIDAAYDVEIEETEGTVDLNIYTDAYYDGAETVSDTSEDLYLKVPSSLYSSSYTYYAQFSDGSSTDWVKATYLKSATSGGFRSSSTCYYYTLEKPSDATSIVVYIYSGTPSSEAASGYKYCSDKCTLSSTKDMLTLSSSGTSTLNISMGSYSATTSTGPGAGTMEEGNTDKTSYSAKGIKAANAITITSGTIVISAGDDALHANHDEAIDADTADSYGYGAGDITINGGTLTITSNDDGIHADGDLTITDGTITVLDSYEGLEGGAIYISGGTIVINSDDDGINGTVTSSEDKGYVTTVYGYVKISGGYIYIIAGGDGLDSNGTTSGCVTISGGEVIIVSTSSGNSAIDTDAAYKYTDGYLFAVCPQGMTSEMTNVSGGSYTTKTGSFSTSTYITVKYGSAATMVMKMPVSISNVYAFALYSSSPTISTSTSNSYTLDSNGVYWSI